MQLTSSEKGHRVKFHQKNKKKKPECNWEISLLLLYTEILEKVNRGKRWRDRLYANLFHVPFNTFCAHAV